MSKKVTLKVQLNDEEAEKNAVEKVRGLQGFCYFYKDMNYENDEKNQKWIVIGNIDPVDVVNKLRKLCTVELLTVLPEQEPEKKEEPENSSKEKKAVPEKGQEPKKKKKEKETKEEEPEPKKKEKETKEEEPEPKKKEKETKEEEPEPKKKEKETKEEEPEPKKEKETKKEERAKKVERPKNDDVAKLVSAYQAYNPYKNV